MAVVINTVVTFYTDSATNKELNSVCASDEATIKQMCQVAVDPEWIPPALFQRGLTSSRPARGSSRPGGRPTQRMTPHRGGFSFTSTREPTSSPGTPRGGLGGRGDEGGGGEGSGCSPITDWTERESGP